MLLLGSYQSSLFSHAYGCMQDGLTARMVTAPPVSTVITDASQYPPSP